MGNLDEDELRAAAARGAKFLDRIQRRWFKNLDPQKLIMEDCGACVMGLLYGSYLEGLQKVWFIGNEERVLRRAMYHGFIFFEPDPGWGVTRKAYSVLDAAWRDEIAARLPHRRITRPAAKY